jgi:hypothetical protein
MLSPVVERILRSGIGFIQVGAARACEAFVAWENEILAPYGLRVSAQPLSGSLNDAVEHLFPLTLPVRTRFLFLSTDSSWTAFLDNGIHGTDAAGSMCVLGERLRCQAMRVTCTPDTMPRVVTRTSRGSFGAVIWELYAENGDTRRSIFAANDGGTWKFGQSGEPFEFEQLSQYKRKRIRERFTEGLLQEYLRHFGIRLLSPEFYMPGTRQENFLVTKMGALPSNMIAVQPHELGA